MKLAYIVSAYKLPDQLIRLVDRLDSSDATFLVHVDGRASDDIFGQIREGLRGRANSHLLRRHDCVWGGFGHVAATLEGIREIVNSDVDCEYVILLTGQDYPIKANALIQQFLEIHRGQLFLEHFPLPHPDWQNAGMDRIETWHLRLLDRHFTFRGWPAFGIRRSFPRRFAPYGGSSYWCLTKASVEYISAFAKDNPGFVNFFKYADVPDELIFQTIIMNSPWRDLAVNDDLRYIEWNDPLSGSPAVLTSDRFESLRASPKLFARKFDSTVDDQVLDQIDRVLLGGGDT